MANYTARNMKEVNEALRKIREKNTEMIAAMQGSKLGRIGVQAGLIVQARAQEIITEKGHVVTGMLRRSINTQLVELGAYTATIEVGSFMHYAPYVENLPDGGYLYEASVQTFPEFVKFLNDNGIRPVLEAWAR